MGENRAEGRRVMPSSPQPQEMRSVRALLNRVIDYAGLFPPAKLDMASTVRNYAEYLKGNDSWMLGRLIVPVARLDEFEEQAAPLLPTSESGALDIWQISALPAAAGTQEFSADVERIEAFNARHEDDDAGRALIDVVEIKADSASAIERALESLTDEAFSFFELPIRSDPQAMVATIADLGAGAKVRTGGVTADLYPSPAELARFIAACAEVNVPFKATAGMHHPLRHHSESMNTDEFGFLNVFIAASLALTDELDEQSIVAILQETSLSAFTFTDEAVMWRDYRLSAESIEDVREEFALSFGSCSFDEPREDLRRLGLL
jgi:hypothetical protein